MSEKGWWRSIRTSVQQGSLSAEGAAGEGPQRVGLGEGDGVRHQLLLAQAQWPQQLPEVLLARQTLWVRPILVAQFPLVWAHTHKVKF